MFYFAYLDENNVVTGVYQVPSDLSSLPGYVSITAEQYNDPTLIGKVYDPETNTFNDPIVWACTTADVQYKSTNTSLEEKLDAIDEALENAGTGSSVDAYTKTESDGRYATADHTHTGFASSAHTHTAADVSGVVKTINGNSPDENGNVVVSVSGGGTGTPGADGEDGATFTPSVSAEGVLSWTNDKNLTNPTPVNIKGTNGITPHIGANGNWFIGETDTGVAAQGASGTEITAAQILEKIATVDGQNSGLDADLLDGHNSDYFATATQLEGKANAEHTHDDYINTTTYANGMNGKANADHTHTPASIGAAPSSHSHSGYATEGHTHSGYASSSHTHTPASIGASASGHSHSTNGSCEFTGTIRTRDIVPGSNDTYNIGGYSNRYKFIYSVNQLQVSSDERVKKDIKALSADELSAFVKALNVVEYKYKDDESNKARIGLIAQQVVDSNPALASYFVREEEDGMLALSVADLVFPLISTVQNLIAKVEELESKAE